MKRKCLALLCCISSVLPAWAGMVVGQPGFYGVIELGNAPVPQVVFPQPVVVQPAPYGVVLPPPIYLRVPPGYARHWRWHCREFQACGRPVYFVRDNWYRQVYVPYYLPGEPRRGREERYEDFRGDRLGRD